MKFLRRLGAALAITALLLGVAVATRSWWLPQRYAVNVPVRSLIGGGERIAAPSLAGLRVPPGFTVTRFAADLPNARFLRVTDQGDIVVSQPRESKVTLVFRDSNGDGVSDGSVPLLTGLDRPHGLALKDGFLYVAEMTAVGRVRFDAVSRAVSGTFERVITGLPSGGNHWTRTIGFGPDGFLYIGGLKLQCLCRNGRSSCRDIAVRPANLEGKRLRRRPAQLGRIRMACGARFGRSSRAHRDRQRP